MNGLLQIALAYPLAGALFASAGSVAPEILEAINRTCIPLEEMVLAGIQLGDSRTTVETALGSPIPRRDQDEPVDVLAYEALRIRLHDSRVQSVRATSDAWSTPRGIKPGLSPREVSTILGFDLDSARQPHGRWPTGYGIHRCIDPDEQIDVEQYLRLDLSPDGSIEAVEIFWVAP